MLRLRHLSLLAALCACHRPAPPYDLESFVPAALPTDSVVLARLQQQHPCSGDATPIRADDALPAAERCTLVATAIAAIHDEQGAPEIAVDLRRFRPSDAGCATVRAEAYRNDRTGEITLARWVVEFPSDIQPSLAVEIDRRTGIARAYRELREFGYTAGQLCSITRPADP